MPLVSVQISVGPRILKPWGIVSTDITASLWDVFTGVRDGHVAGSSSFTFPSELRDQLLRKPFQDCCLSFTVGDVISL